jgi:hypothetical protein
MVRLTPTSAEADSVREDKPHYFAELFVAGRFADAGWNVYFPHRDDGIDFIAVRPGVDGVPLIRPVQVKGKYPDPDKTDKTVYGYVGKLTQLHPDMVLAIPFFRADDRDGPVHIAYMPRSQVKGHSRGVHCEPATFKGGAPSPRRDFAHFFDDEGLVAVARADWG